MQALSKFVIRELHVSIFCIILLALKEVVITNNYTHSSSLVLTVLATNNPTRYSPVCQVRLQFMQWFLCLFSKMWRICMTERYHSTDSSVKLVQISPAPYLEGPCKLHGYKLKIQNSLRGCLEHFSLITQDISAVCFLLFSGDISPLAQFSANSLGIVLQLIAVCWFFFFHFLCMYKVENVHI